MLYVVFKDTMTRVFCVASVLAFSACTVSDPIVMEEDVHHDDAPQPPPNHNLPQEDVAHEGSRTDVSTFDTPSDRTHVDASTFDTPSDRTHVDASTFDAPSDRTHVDASAFDTPSDRTHVDATPTTDRAPTDTPSAMDGSPPRCDPRFSFVPTSPGDDAGFEVAVTDSPGYVHVGMQVVGPGAPVATWIGVTGSSPFTWRWRVSGHVAGTYFFRFTVDMGTREIATCVQDVAARGGPRDAGLDATSPPGGPSTTPPTNRFGIGLVGPGNPDDLDRSANLVGPGGYVKLIFAGVRPGMTGPTAEWSTAVREAYARDLVPVIRFAPDWGDRRVRNQSDDGSGTRFTRLAAAYAAIVRGLPLRAGWPLYVETHNEPNLCYEWSCDPGAFPDNRITMARMAAEYAALLRDVAAALHALGDPRIRVTNGGLAPGGVRWCLCVGPRDVQRGEWEGGTTSLDFIAAMRAAVPSSLTTIDAWASHAYPASGRGYGFFPPYASAGVGLRYFHDELAAVGRSLPVLLTETGWSVRRDGGGTNSRDEIASWTVQAYRDFWLTDPSIRAVMPFMLRDAAWEDFAWISASGSEYPVYRAVRAFRCSRIPGRCP